MLFEEVTEDYCVAILRFEIVRHWYKCHLGASLEDQVSLRIKEINELPRVGCHDREEPVASILDGLTWDEVSQIFELLRHFMNKGKFLLVHLFCISPSPLDNHGQDCSAWLVPELAKETLCFCKASHPAHIAGFQLHIVEIKTFPHAPGNCREIIKLPNHKGCP